MSRIAPTLAPLSLVALQRGFWVALTGRAPTDGLSRQLERLYPASQVTTFSSGRGALATALRTAMAATGRQRVVLPAYTSYSVAAAARAAGALVDLCDLDPATLQLDRDALRRCVDDRTAAVLLGNLYGFPDVTQDLGWIQREGALLIDDAAQALGAAEGDQAAGARGDLGVLSFGRGKCVALGDAGALLVHRPDLARETPMGEPGSRSRGWAQWLMSWVTRGCANPLVFGVLSRLPGGRIGESWYQPEFDIRPAPVGVDGLAYALGAEVGRQRAIRERVADAWRSALAEVPGLSWPRPASGTQPAYLRFPVYARDRARRELLVARLAEARFAYVRSFPGTLRSIAAFRPRCSDRPTPGADEIADRIVALPCHAGVATGDVRRAAGVAPLAEPGPASTAIISLPTNYVTR